MSGRRTMDMLAYAKALSIRKTDLHRDLYRLKVQINTGKWGEIKTWQIQP